MDRDLGPSLADRQQPSEIWDPALLASFVNGAFIIATTQMVLARRVRSMLMLILGMIVSSQRLSIVVDLVWSPD